MCCPDCLTVRTDSKEEEEEEDALLRDIFTPILSQHGRPRTPATSSTGPHRPAPSSTRASGSPFPAPRARAPAGGHADRTRVPEEAAVRAPTPGAASCGMRFGERRSFLQRPASPDVIVLSDDGEDPAEREPEDVEAAWQSPGGRDEEMPNAKPCEGTSATDEPRALEAEICCKVNRKKPARAPSRRPQLKKHDQICRLGEELRELGAELLVLAQRVPLFPLAVADEIAEGLMACQERDRGLPPGSAPPVESGAVASEARVGSGASSRGGDNLVDDQQIGGIGAESSPPMQLEPGACDDSMEAGGEAWPSDPADEGASDEEESVCPSSETEEEAEDEHMDHSSSGARTSSGTESEESGDFEAAYVHDRGEEASSSPDDRLREGDETSSGGSALSPVAPPCMLETDDPLTPPPQSDLYAEAVEASEASGMDVEQADNAEPDEPPTPEDPVLQHEADPPGPRSPEEDDARKSSSPIDPDEAGSTPRSAQVATALDEPKDMDKLEGDEDEDEEEEEEEEETAEQEHSRSPTKGEGEEDLAGQVEPEPASDEPRDKEEGDDMGEEMAEEEHPRSPTKDEVQEGQEKIAATVESEPASDEPRDEEEEEEDREEETVEEEHADSHTKAEGQGHSEAPVESEPASAEKAKEGCTAGEQRRPTRYWGFPENGFKFNPMQSWAFRKSSSGTSPKRNPLLMTPRKSAFVSAAEVLKREQSSPESTGDAAAMDSPPVQADIPVNDGNKAEGAAHDVVVAPLPAAPLDGGAALAAAPVMRDATPSDGAGTVETGMEDSPQHDEDARDAPHSGMACEVGGSQSAEAAPVEPARPAWPVMEHEGEMPGDLLEPVGEADEPARSPSQPPTGTTGPDEICAAPTLPCMSPRLGEEAAEETPGEDVAPGDEEDDDDDDDGGISWTQEEEEGLRRRETEWTPVKGLFHLSLLTLHAKPH
jgi:hypothetical protein